MIIHNCEQGSDEWHKLRLGKPTASRFSNVLAKGQGKTRKSYMYDLASEIMTETQNEFYTNEFMERGKELEDEARKQYCLLNDCEAGQIGFVTDDQEKYGCSPDALIGEGGILEIKCPKTTTHIEYLLSEKIPSKYTAQIQGNLFICEREWCDFVSYDPRVKNDSYIYTQRVYRDEVYIKNLKDELDRFINDLNNMMEKLK